MPYRYLDDLSVADAAFEATGASLEELFAAAWEAVLHLMIENPDDLRDAEDRLIDLHEPSVELLLYSFLGELLFWKDAEQTFYRLGSVGISGNDEVGYAVEARISGERIEPARHDLGIDIKGVTLDQFHVTFDGEEWSAQVIVDV